jgi:hypothetical protein
VRVAAGTRVVVDGGRHAGTVRALQHRRSWAFRRFARRVYAVVDLDTGDRVIRPVTELEREPYRA